MSTEKKVDSNRTGLAIAEEVALGVLPDGSAESVTIGAATTNAKITDIQLSWDSVLMQLRIDATIAAGETYMVARVNRDRSSTVTNDVGEQNAIGSDGSWNETDDPAGSIGRWQVTGPQTVGFPSTIFVIVDLADVVQDGDILIVEIDDTDNYDGVSSVLATRSITLTDIATGTTVWYGMEPNSYGDFGGEVTTTPRNFINSSRQRRKGPTTDLEASGEFNQDKTVTNMNRLLQGFMFADAYEATSSDYISDAISLDVVSFAANGTLTLSGPVSGFNTRHIVRTTGFANDVNNGVWIVGNISGSTLTGLVHIDGETVPVAENANQNNPQVEIVGFALDDGEDELTIVGNRLLLTDFSEELLDNNSFLQVGQWVWIGGDEPETKYANNQGFARIDEFHEFGFYLVEPSWATPVAEAGAGGRTLHVYFSKFIRNEDEPDKQICRTYQLERSLGKNAAGTQAEYLVGAVADSYALNLPSADKMNVDMGFMALRTEYRTHAQGLKAGTRVAPGIEEAYDTANSIYLMRMYVHDATKVKPDSLFAYVMEGSLTINNNAKANRALGCLGGFSVTVGTFEVGGELTCYFEEVEALMAVRNNADVGLYFIGTKDNYGFVYDLPLVGLQGGRNDVELNEPVKLAIEHQGSENEYGFTLGYSFFAYLPNDAMPDIEDC